MRKEHAIKCPANKGENIACLCDGYHTFGELYDHRIALFIALCKHYPSKAWKSKKHHDGTSWDGWFIAGIGTRPGEQISYHLPESYWDTLTNVDIREIAPLWDGHTPDDVINRLLEI